MSENNTYKKHPYEKEGCALMGCWGVGIVVMLFLLGPIGWLGLVVLAVCGYKFYKA